MPLYLCRWPNGDCSIVWSANKVEAIETLDEVDNAEGCPLRVLRDFMVHFRLSDEGEIQLETLGEATADTLFQLAYPVLDKALMEAPKDEVGNLTPDGIASIREAVAEERKRVRPKKAKEPETELGQEIKKLMNAPTRMIDRSIRDTATKTLQQLPVKGKPN